jgi:Uma2 family endonuclease
MSRENARARPGDPEPTWDVAHLFPGQGNWSEEEYLALSSNRLVEYSHGTIEVPPMPTEKHQAIVAFLYEALLLFVRPQKLGKIVFAPFRVRLWPGKYREPDIAFMLAAHAARRHDEYWEGADLVIEVVSDDDRRRDLVTKRREYAEAGIPEYWMVDPQERRIVVLGLDDAGTYAERGVHGPGSEAVSGLLPGFTVEVDAALAAD